MGNANKKFTTIHYHSYLQLDKVLDAQKTRSNGTNGEAAHEETLFIIIHQVYELWFKQIKHELKSVLKHFRNQKIDERSVGTIVARLNRVEEILKLLIQQIQVLETMTPLDFLDFRAYLFPASGFQSFQFRVIEAMLGLPEEGRMTYNNIKYSAVFLQEQQTKLKSIYEKGTLFDMVEDWLERTPFLQFGDFDFLKYYKKAVENMLANERAAIQASDYLSEKNKAKRIEMLGDTNTHYQYIFDKGFHQQMKTEGKLRLSYKASVAALLINLYRDEPILHGPYNLLLNLVDIDSLMTTWRYRHAQMVLRMLGRKTGTGGSSGYEYLMGTAMKHQIFNDLHSISTLLIPRSELPALPDQLKKELGFYFTEKHSV